jgi:Holliday junction resolvase-like predicted endonuclease
MYEKKKSSNHSQITGDFAEHLILYWLSSYGFECVHVRHTGIDIIASKPDGERLGISVKSRSRKTGQIDSALTINNPIKEFKKLDAACLHFACKPYMAFVIDQSEKINAYITTKENLLKGRTLSTASSQNFSYKNLEHDVNTMKFTLEYQTSRWFL